MDNKSFLVTIILIFVAGLFIGSWSTGGFTGQITRADVTRISASPSVISAGDFLTVDVIPGSSGASSEFDIYFENRFGQVTRKGAGSEIKYCRGVGIGSTCTKPTSYRLLTSDNWNSGTYYVQVLDKGTKQYVRSYFSIR